MTNLNILLSSYMSFMFPEVFVLDLLELYSQNNIWNKIGEFQFSYCHWIFPHPGDVFVGYDMSAPPEV